MRAVRNHQHAVLARTAADSATPITFNFDRLCFGGAVDTDARPTLPTELAVLDQCGDAEFFAGTAPTSIIL